MKKYFQSLTFEGWLAICAMLPKSFSKNACTTFRYPGI